jgi:hypothetical protein
MEKMENKEMWRCDTKELDNTIAIQTQALLNLPSSMNLGGSQRSK